MDFRTLFKGLTNSFRTKSWQGILPGDLPVNDKKWGANDFLSALEISLYTDKAIGKRSDKVGEIEFKLEDARGNVIERDPLLDLLYKPNKVFTGRQFWSLYQIYRDVIGEAYIFLESDRQIFESKRITAMHLLMPTLVTPKFNEDGSPRVYEYRTGDKTVEYKPEQILYVHRPDPKNPLRGRSLLRAGVSTIQTEADISSYHSRVLKNGGKVEGVFKFKTTPLTEAQLTEIKAKYRKEYAGAKKSGSPLFLGGDADYVRMGLTPDELSFLEAKKMTLTDICIMTGVPQSLLGSTNDVKFDNADADRAIFLRETIRPELVTLTTLLDERLFPDDRTLTFIDPTPENVEEKRKNVETANSINALTINEKRELLKGLGITVDPVDGGGDILVPFNLTPLGSSTPAGGKGKKSAEEQEHPLRDADMRRIYWNMQIKRMDAREKKFKKVLGDYFSGQEKRLTTALSPKQLRYFRKSQVDELLSLELEVQIGKELFLPVLTELLKDAGIDAMEFAGSDYEFNLSASIRSWLDNHSEAFLNKINETTFTELKQQFSESLDQGEGRDDLVKRVRETYDGITKARSETIARTEVHNATQYGTMEGYRQGGLKTKIWVAVMDSHTRDTHAMVDGEERPLDRLFSNGLMFPGDPNGPPGEIINCRCVI